MNFKVFMTKMLPSFGKRTLTTELDQINDKLKSFSIPAYVGLDKDPFNSDTSKYYEGLYTKRVTRGNMYKGILTALKTCLELGEYLEDQVDAKFNEDITRASLSAYTLNVLRLIETIDFISDYSRRLCRYLATTAVNKQRNRPELEGIVKAEQIFIDSYKHSYFNGLKIINTSVKDIQAKLDKIPDVMVTPDNIDSVGAAVGKQNVDPLALNFFSPKANPSMFFVNKIARYQANKYTQAKLDLQEIQVKVLKLKQLKGGKDDAKLDSQIEYYENLNDKIRANIEEMEEDYDIS